MQYKFFLNFSDSVAQKSLMYAFTIPYSVVAFPSSLAKQVYRLMPTFYHQVEEHNVLP